MEEKTKEMNANMPNDNELDANMLNETELGDVGGGKTEPSNLRFQGPKHPKTPATLLTCQTIADTLLQKDGYSKPQYKLHSIEELHSIEGIPLSDGDE